jgi:hypothetical protein
MTDICIYQQDTNNQIMKIFRLSLFFCLLLSGVVLKGQNTKDKAAKVKYYSYPTLSVEDVQSLHLTVYAGSSSFDQSSAGAKQGLISKIYDDDKLANYAKDYKMFNPITLSEQGDLNIEVAFGPFTMLGKDLQDHKIPCVIGGKISKETIKECPAYYYDINYTLPVVLKVSDKDGKVLFSELFDSKELTQYGYDKSKLSGFLSTAKLEEAYNKEGTVENIEKKAYRSRFKNIEYNLLNCLYFEENVDKPEIVTGKGKFDYDELDRAQDLAIAGLAKLPSVSTPEELNEAISIWDKEIKSVVLEDNKARISGKIAGYLHVNKVIAYYYTHDLAKAEASLQDAQEICRSIRNNSQLQYQIDRWNENINEKRDLIDEIEKNKILVAGQALQAKTIMGQMMVPEEQAPYQIIIPEDKFAGLKNDYYAWSKADQPGDQTSSGEFDLSSLFGGALSESDLTLTDTTGNTYENQVDFAPNMGFFVNLSFSNHEKIPAEVFEIKRLNTILINNSELKEISPDIVKMENLKTLNLASNNLTELPAFMGEITKLKKLNVSKNQLTSLPEELKQCENLKSLNIKGNSIPQSQVDELQAALPKCKIKL